ncbi:MAG TPA: ATP-binding protein [Gemmatimonadaceae bacterium]
MGIDDYWPPFVDRLVSASEIALLITSSVPPKSKVSKVRHAVSEGPHATGVGFIQAMPVARRVLHAHSVGRLGARRGRGARINENLAVRVDAKIQSFKRPGTEKDHVAGLAEYDLVTRAEALGVNRGETGPALERGVIRLPKVPQLELGNAKRLENVSRNPGELGSGVDESAWNHAAFARSPRILDLEADAKGSHVAHDSSDVMEVIVHRTRLDITSTRLTVRKCGCLWKSTSWRSCRRGDSTRRPMFKNKGRIEAIVNAVAHRDYASNASVQVMLFSDRLEIWNPGELPSTLTLASLREPHPSVPRNPLLAGPMFLAGYIEKAGTGILDMLARCREAGLPTPAFQQESGLFKQIFTRRLTPEVTGEVTTEVTGEVTTEVTTEVTPVLRLLGVLHGTMSRGDLQEVLELKNAEHFRKTYLVPALEAGLIEMTIPDKPKSRLQKYRLTSAGRAKLADARSTGER